MIISDFMFIRLFALFHFLGVVFGLLDSNFDFGCAHVSVSLCQLLWILNVLSAAALLLLLLLLLFGVLLFGVLLLRSLLLLLQHASDFDLPAHDHLQAI